MLSAVVVAAILGSAAAGSAPQIAQSNSRFDSSLIKLVNGQTRQSSGKSFWDLPNNRTRFDSKEQGVTIITRYDLGKEFGISGSQCQYCPTSSTQGRYGPPPGAAYIGSTAVGSVSCDVWQNNVTLGPTVMQVNNWCIANDKSTPVQEYTRITPFGKFEGTATTNVTDFKAGPQDPSLFKIPGGPSNCQKSSKCKSTMADLLSGSAAGQHVSQFGLLRDLATQAWSVRLGLATA